MKVIVAMSGGVDSSTAAYLLKKQGYEVSGLSFTLMETRGVKDINPNICCSIKAIESASQSSRHIGIPHSVVDLRAEFIQHVIEPFIEAYSNGITPNPCILCNRFIKFPYLLMEAEEKGADFIATGHYANTAPSLRKGIDQRKDQSYVLYALKKEELRRLILPLGGLRKDEVRAIAKTQGLPSASRLESQEICFIKDKNYSSFIGSFLPQKEGPIIDTKGNVIGTHKGLYRYTIGQRKRLGISSLEPLYVNKIDTANNALYIGARNMALKKEFLVSEVNWLIPKREDFRAGVKIRSMMPDKSATVYIMNDDTVDVLYDEPEWAPSAGQSAVFYEGDMVIGGGVIQSP
ncbi:MAG: tRNA 2-thiouridine(34) synthase MnmA [Nitrospirae bacterium]|nr:tRNA 2-thiouridine(34) synthase MnmA [Nitrospirota bacterium]